MIAEEILFFEDGKNIDRQIFIVDFQQMRLWEQVPRRLPASAGPLSRFGKVGSGGGQPIGRAPAELPAVRPKAAWPR